ncbi:MAG: hypothetical protein WAS73_13810 [Defluviicoccus sp.]
MASPRREGAIERVDLVFEFGVAANHGGDLGGGEIRSRGVNVQARATVHSALGGVQGIERFLRLRQAPLTLEDRAHHFETIGNAGVTDHFPVRPGFVIVAFDLAIEVGVAQRQAGCLHRNAEGLDLDSESPVAGHGRRRSVLTTTVTLYADM